MLIKSFLFWCSIMAESKIVKIGEKYLLIPEQTKRATVFLCTANCTETMAGNLPEKPESWTGSDLHASSESQSRNPEPALWLQTGDQPCIHRWACEQRESTQNISKTSCPVKKRGSFSQNAENYQISKSTFFIKQEKVFKTIVLFFIKGYKM